MKMPLGLGFTDVGSSLAIRSLLPKPDTCWISTNVSGQGQPLQADEFVISADEKTSIQARARLHPTQAPQPGQPMKIEHEYERRGALTYLAALDVHRAKLFGHCQPQSGIVAFDGLVDQVMNHPPYSQARR